MILCSNCHVSYDASYPYWTLLPVNLSLFVSHEIADYESRVSVASSGKQPPSRTLPSSADAKEYTPHFLADIVSEVGIRLSDFPKPWLGMTPQVVVLKTESASERKRPSRERKGETSTSPAEKENDVMGSINVAEEEKGSR
ncbi:hypothetical protein V8E54_007709 [Elaphomyces granulatus]|jgi:hypothetical protein